ncbi:glycosyltransferase family 2 protein [Methylotuvimicrobium alcaliphilum]|uniref:Glycosyl transferase n=1 Tax=Methylotuvimicrobium alcaliphilum (strain DSM 19304 / NCIMB 14124 / VKM B-2133 / 20Z) TaxID=1091494 RepID=G4T1K9_META2|nr:glycosyltransferase family 2 protein [Methylotuvimicrobium alcaliphilum]CCE22431.1 putative glycosyl transferase [Methylotuvimicrobium alcaliphilum 20Z]HYH13783.1 glycosyltransferase family 2 protein [Flavisolibacter sp.]
MKISVITATYNSEKTLQACLESVVSQTALEHIEHIIVDGRSTDSTLTLVNNYPHVSKVISAKDRGIYHAFNRGVELATGDVVYFLNSDDCFYDDKVIEQVISEFTSAHQYYLGAVLCINPNNGNSYFTIQQDTTLANRRPCHQGFFCRLEMFEEFGVFNECFNIAADMYLMKKIMQHTKGIVTDRPIAKFSLRGMSSNDDSKAILLRQHGMIDELLDNSNSQHEMSEKLTMQTQNLLSFKQLMLNILQGSLNVNFLKEKRLVIFGTRELSQLFYLFLSQQRLQVIGFVVSSADNLLSPYQHVPVLSLQELHLVKPDVVVNCIEGNHEAAVTTRIREACPSVDVLSWRDFTINCLISM